MSHPTTTPPAHACHDAGYRHEALFYGRSIRSFPDGAAVRLHKRLS